MIPTTLHLIRTTQFRPQYLSILITGSIANNLRQYWLVSGLPGALYSILRFAAAQSLLSNCKQSPYWILFCPLRIDTPTFQTKNKQLKLSFLIDFPQKYDL